MNKTSDKFQQLIDRQANFISENQLSSGAIPWYRGGITDPWDHVEGAIALDLSGRVKEATSAYIWSQTMQNSDGSWYSSYIDDKVQDLTKDTNFTSYIATGLWFHYLVTKDLSFLYHMWPMVKKGIEFALKLQQPTGEISYGLDKNDKPWPGALLTSSCCIWHSIRNGIRISEILKIPMPEWDEASKRLFRAITEKPEIFDRMGENRRRYAMNWFYPILTGIVAGKEAQDRIEKEWEDFIIDDWGCRVSADEDLTAVAETSELIIALCLIGEHKKAKSLMDWIFRLRDNNGGFCRGTKLPENEEFPKERATWTSAALIMAIAAMAKT
ncbi:MAG: prenyltransferase [Thermodesulfobacteriota bacterium]|nr:prenyltransferase [Thermodesulfobacteriota bacterium]